MENNSEKYYCIAYKDKEGNGFSSFEPWVMECNDDLCESITEANELKANGNKDVTIFYINDLDKENMESVTWEYVDAHKVL